MSLPTWAEIFQRVRDNPAAQLTMLEGFIIAYEPQDHTESWRRALADILAEAKAQAIEEAKQQADLEIVQERVQHGSGSQIISGRCGEKVTLDMLRERFYHSEFGGRNARIMQGRFEIVRHTS